MRLLLPLFLLLAACSPVGTQSSEKDAYLAVMAQWHQDWAETGARGEWFAHEDPFDPALDGLLTRFFAIENVPGSYRSLHREYGNAHRTYVYAKRLFYYIDSIEKRRFLAMRDDHIPACDIRQHLHVSEEYVWTCAVNESAIENLSQVRAYWEIQEFDWGLPSSRLD